MDKVKLLWSKTNRWHRGLVIFFIVAFRWIPGGKVGFICNDPALSHEFTGDTITARHLFATIFLLPLAVASPNCLYLFTKEIDGKNFAAVKLVYASLFFVFILLLVERYHPDRTAKPRQAIRWYKEYCFGMLVNLIVVESLKVCVGSPRPHFFDTCGPKEATTCEGSEYVSHYTCTKVHWLTQSNTSFPSGHTSLAVHAGVFLICYLHQRAKRSTTVLGAQIILFLVSLYCGVSRMLDHRHHWWDVLAGAILGLPIVVYTVVYLCNNFNLPSEDKVLQPNGTQTTNNIENAPLIDATET